MAFHDLFRYPTPALTLSLSHGISLLSRTYGVIDPSKVQCRSACIALPAPREARSPTPTSILLHPSLCWRGHERTIEGGEGIEKPLRKAWLRETASLCWGLGIAECSIALNFLVFLFFCFFVCAAGPVLYGSNFRGWRKNSIFSQKETHLY